MTVKARRIGAGWPDLPNEPGCGLRAQKLRVRKWRVLRSARLCICVSDLAVVNSIFLFILVHVSENLLLQLPIHAEYGLGALDERRVVHHLDVAVAAAAALVRHVHGQVGRAL